MATLYPVEAFADRRGPSELHEVFLHMGWPEQFVAIITPAQAGVSLIRLGEPEKPRIIVVTSQPEDASQAVSLGYSGEADFTVRWREDHISLFETTRWSSVPGDIEVWAADTREKANLSNFVGLLGPSRDAELSLAALRPDRGIAHPRLSRRLGQALAGLRMRVFEAAVWSELDPDDRDVEVLRVFHRLLYVRYHEDRHGPLTNIRLRDLLDVNRIDNQLAGLLEAYEAELDSSLFEQRLEPLRLPADAWRDVVRSMTEPWEELELDFSVSTSDLAGRLYQSYLEERPRVDEGAGRLFPMARAVDERLARGAYYTPVALSARLVSTTLGSWLERRRPLAFHEVSVLDPACGSGAFLLSAYRHLITYFEGLKQRRLRTHERAELLTTSIFGADADESALLLARVQLLEEANVGRRELPELEANFRKGDSLLGRPGTPAQSDVDWEGWMEARGGKFDVVVMNPPFASQKSLVNYMSKEHRDQLRELYGDVWKWGGDLAYMFLALAYDLLGTDGGAGVILPRSGISAPSGQPVRELLERDVIDVLDLRGIRAFGSGVSSYVALVTLLRGHDRRQVALSAPLAGDVALRDVLGGGDTIRQTIEVKVAPDELTRLSTWTPFAARYREQVRPRLRTDLEPLIREGGPRRLVQGTQTGANARFTISHEEITWAHDDHAVVRGRQVDTRRLPLLVKGGDIGVMRVTESSQRLLLPFDRPDELGSLDDETMSLIEELGGFPKNPQSGDLQTLLGPKVLLRALAREPAAAADTTGEVITIKGTGGGLALALGPDAETFHVVGAAALINSAFCQWWLQGMGDAKQGGWVELRQSVVEQLPWLHLHDQMWSKLAQAGAQLMDAYAIGDPLERVAAYDQHRWTLDQLAFDAYGVPKHLQELIMSEVVRTG